MSGANQPNHIEAGSSVTAWAAERFLPHSIIALSHLFGGLSLLGLCVFLLLGSFELLPLGMSEWHSLGLDAGLCLIFFIQHSGMIRRSFKRRFTRFISSAYHPAIYSLMSGAALLVLLVFWQRSESVIWSVNGMASWVIWGLFAGAILGFWWCRSALGSLDPFGGEAILSALRGQEPENAPLTIRGPYRIVRHPLYTFALVMIWACPVVTLDRLLFALLWTAWVVLGAILEERDLISDFGESYREYQREVPMLLPWRRGKW